MERAVIVAACVAALLAPLPAYAQGMNGCVYQLGFKAIHDLMPDRVGACLEEEQHDPKTGDAVQHTFGTQIEDAAAALYGGLLVWRRSDNWTAFTDGAFTWVNGPYGLQARPNGSRFSWEANADHLPTQGSPVIPPSVLPIALDLFGAGNQSTETFTVRGDWQLGWWFNCFNYGGPGPLNISVWVPGGGPSANLDVSQGAVWTREGVQHYHDPGTFYLRISNGCRWHVVVRG